MCYKYSRVACWEEKKDVKKKVFCRACLTGYRLVYELSNNAEICGTRRFCV